MGIKAEIHTSAYEGSVVSGSLVIAALTTFNSTLSKLLFGNDITKTYYYTKND